MADLSRIANLLSLRQPGHSLPQAMYNDDAVFDADIVAVFRRNWMLIGFECEVPRAGCWIATTIGGSPVIVLRDRDHRIVGFHNTCRHRGARICTAASGTTPRLACPYHQWTYGLDGKLLAAPRMGDGFDMTGRDLLTIRVEAVAGCIYACLCDEAPDFSAFHAALEANLLPHNLREGKIAHVEVLEENANWKLVVENGRECMHCAACHPELGKIFPVTIADRNSYHEDLVASGHAAQLAVRGFPTTAQQSDWWQIGRFGFLPGVQSYALDGQPLVTRKLVEIAGDLLGSLRAATEPNNFVHVSADNAVMVLFEPVSTQHTRVTTKWLVHKDAVEGVDYDVPRLIAAWDATNRQDRALAENNQAGINGMGYRPGPYSPIGESYVNSFVDWYCQTLGRYVAQGAGSASA